MHRTSKTNQLDGSVRLMNKMGLLDRPAGLTSWKGRLDGPAGRTSWTDQLGGPAWRTSWMDWLDGQAGSNSWTDQFCLFEALVSLHIQRLIFQFVHCRSFQVWRRPCFHVIKIFIGFKSIRSIQRSLINFQGWALGKNTLLTVNREFETSLLRGATHP